MLMPQSLHQTLARFGLPPLALPPGFSQHDALPNDIAAFVPDVSEDLEDESVPVHEEGIAAASTRATRVLESAGFRAASPGADTATPITGTFLDPALRRIASCGRSVAAYFGRHALFTVRGNRQVAAPGFEVPLKAFLGKTLIGPFQKGVDGVSVHFYALSPSGDIIDIGPAVTNANGQATAYFMPTEAGEYKIFYQFGRDATRLQHEHGTLTVLPQDKPVVALDIDDIVKTYGDGLDPATEIVRRVNGYDGRYRLVALSYSRGMRERLAEAGLKIPVIENDYHSSPFRRLKSGFGETQLEKLKRLKFECGLPVVGVVSRPFKARTSYLPSGIEIVDALDIDNPYAFEASVYGEMLEARFREFHESLKKPREEFYWDGMTQSRLSSGNHLEYFTDNRKAEAELFRLINGAKSFIHLANYAIHNDEFGHKVLKRLKERAQEGLRVRLIVDLMSQGPLPTDKGFSWLDTAMLKEMEDAGVEIAYHEMFQKPDDDQAQRGLLTRRHSKMVVVDYEDEKTPLQIVAHGGGRIIGSMAYDEMRLDANWFWRKLFNLGRGSFRDLSVTFSGPVVGTISERFNADFKDYGGEIAPEEEALTLGPVVEQSQNVTLRHTTHQSYLNQNCHNAIMHLFKHPSSRNPFVVNSFYPTDEIIDSWITGARSGKQFTVYFSMFWWAAAKRNKLISRLVNEGIDVIVVPYQLHTKLYGNDEYFAFGNQNLEILSQHDSEDLTLVKRTEGDAQPLEDYLAQLRRDGFHINEHFARGADPKAVTDFVEGIEITVPFTLKAFTHHGFMQAVPQLTWFIGHAFYQGARDFRPWHLMYYFHE